MSMPGCAMQFNHQSFKVGIVPKLTDPVLYCNHILHKYLKTSNLHKVYVKLGKVC